MARANRRPGASASLAGSQKREGEPILASGLKPTAEGRVPVGQTEGPIDRAIRRGLRTGAGILELGGKAAQVPAKASRALLKKVGMSPLRQGVVKSAVGSLALEIPGKKAVDASKALRRLSRDPGAPAKVRGAAWKAISLERRGKESAYKAALMSLSARGWLTDERKKEEKPRAVSK